MKSEEKSKLIAIGCFLGAILVIIIVSCIMIKPEKVAKLDKIPTVKIKDYTDDIDDLDSKLAEYYKFDQSSGDGAYAVNQYLILNKEDKTFEYMYGNTAMTSGDGTYTTENNILTCTYTEYGTEGSMQFVYKDGYLFLVTGICAGTIPDGDTFDATVYQKSSDTSQFTYEFKADGSYTLSEQMISSDELKEYSADGTYTRDGDLIYTTIADINNAPYLVWNNTMIANFYSAIDEDQYNAEQAELEAESEAASEEAAEEAAEESEAAESTESVESTEN